MRYSDFCMHKTAYEYENNFDRSIENGIKNLDKIELDNVIIPGGLSLIAGLLNMSLADKGASKGKAFLRGALTGGSIGALAEYMRTR